MERLTGEGARSIELSLNPIKRLGQLAEYGAGFGLKKTGMSPLPLFLTRGDLVRAADASEQAQATLDTLEQAE